MILLTKSPGSYKKFQGRIPEIFLLVFWMKLIFHKDILKLTDLYVLWNVRSTCFCLFFGGNWRQQKDISKLSDLWIYSLLIRIKLENEKKRSSSKAVLNTICSMHVVESKLNWKFRVIAFILSMWKSVYRVFHIIQAI